MELVKVRVLVLLVVAVAAVLVPCAQGKDTFMVSGGGSRSMLMGITAFDVLSEEMPTVAEEFDWSHAYGLSGGSWSVSILEVVGSKRALAAFHDVVNVQGKKIGLGVTPFGADVGLSAGTQAGIWVNSFPKWKRYVLGIMDDIPGMSMDDVRKVNIVVGGYLPNRLIEIPLFRANRADESISTFKASGIGEDVGEIEVPGYHPLKYHSRNAAKYAKHPGVAIDVGLMSAEAFIRLDAANLATMSSSAFMAIADMFKDGIPTRVELVNKDDAPVKELVEFHDGGLRCNMPGTPSVLRTAGVSIYVEGSLVSPKGTYQTEFIKCMKYYEPYGFTMVRVHGGSPIRSTWMGKPITMDPRERDVTIIKVTNNQNDHVHYIVGIVFNYDLPDGTPAGAQAVYAVLKTTTPAKSPHEYGATEFNLIQKGRDNYRRIFRSLFDDAYKGIGPAQSLLDDEDLPESDGGGQQEQEQQQQQQPKKTTGTSNGLLGPQPTP